MKPFLEEVAESLVTVLGNDLQDCAIVFNNKRPATYLQQHLAKVIGKPFWSPAFFTIQEFFALSTQLQVADNFTQFFILYKQYNALLADEKQKPITPEVFYPIAQTILSDFNQIDNDLVNANKLFEELEDIAVIQKEFQYLTEEQQDFLKQFWSSFSAGKQQKQQEQFIRMWRRMPKLYQNFHAALKENKQTTIGHIYRNLADETSDNLDFINPFKKIIFVGFNALSKAEEKVFKRWNDEAKALFYFDTDTYYLEDKAQEAGLFLRRNIQFLELPNVLSNERSFIKAKPKAFNVYKVQGQAAQAKILQNTLTKDYPLLQENNNAGKIAVILADETLLMPVLQTIPTQYPADFGYPIQLNVTMGYPLAASTLFGLTDLWLSIQEGYLKEKKVTINHKNAEAFLMHQLTGVSAKESNTLLEQILKEKLLEVPLKLLNPLGDFPALFFKKVEEKGTSVLTLQTILNSALQNALDAKALKQTDADLFAAVLKELNRLHDTIKEYANDLPENFVLSLIRKALQGISVPLSGEPLQGIQVMGLLESRNLDFEHLYIIGANEGVLPKSTSANTFIPDSIRRAYGLPVLENQDAVSAYMFYRLLQRAKNVHLVYNGLNDETNPGEPTRFLKQLEYESDFDFKHFEQQQIISPEKRTPFEVKKEGEVLTKLNQYLDSKGEWAKKISATAFTTYMNCQMQFFFKYIAAIKEPDEIAENLEANQIGSILHHVMQVFYEQLKNIKPEITAKRIAEARKEIPELAKKAYAKVIYEKNEALAEYNGMQQIILAIVEKYADVILNHDETQAPFTIVDLEDKFILPYPIMVNNKKHHINLYGIIDRIDVKDGLTRIVDYKTGKDELTFSNLEDLFNPESPKQSKALIQTLMYTHIYEQAKQKAAIEPNLYIVRKLNEGETRFIEKVGRNSKILEKDYLQSVKQNFKDYFHETLEKLFNPEIPFTQTLVEENCAYCPYLTLCGK